jgi:hypothetical protein
MRKYEKHILKYGLLTTGGLIAFFLLMKIAGLAEITELRALNALIMFSGIYLSIRDFKRDEFRMEFKYQTGMLAGFFTGIVVAVSFAIFVGIYLAIDPAFLEAVVSNNTQRTFINPGTASVIIFIEAMASGMLFSFMSMQYLKPSYHAISNRQEIPGRD